MKRLTMAALVAGQLWIAAQPALAADLTESRTHQMGAFAGVRVRVPLDGAANERPIRAGLTLAPTMHSRTTSGETQLRLGEGIELGIAGRDPVRLSIGGTPVSRLADGPAGPNGPRAGVSTVGWIAIGAGVVILAVGGFYWWLIEEAGDCDPGEC